jgi:hypothetical protein
MSLVYLPWGLWGPLRLSSLLHPLELFHELLAPLREERKSKSQIMQDPGGDCDDSIG